MCCGHATHGRVISIEVRGVGIRGWSRTRLRYCVPLTHDAALNRTTTGGSGLSQLTRQLAEAATGIDQPWSVAVEAVAHAVGEACHAELAGQGVHLPVRHRAAWLAITGRPAWFVSVRDPAGVCRCGFAIEASRSRALPGHRVLRTKRLGPMAGAEPRRCGLAAAVATAREPRVIRYHVEIFCRDEEARREIAHDLAAQGFSRVSKPWSYTETIAIDLRPWEHELLASFHATARRHIRAAEKKPVDVLPIVDPVYGARVGSLLRETLTRTGGHYIRQDWDALIAFTRDHPTLARMVGMFRSGDREPDALWAFAVGYNHGDHVEYGVAASTRDTGGVRLPMGYALAWDLMRWAKRVGAEWFDFGGITRGTQADPDDPLGGISDFKRYFGTDVVTVGEEWVFVPRPVRAAIAGTVAKLARRVLDLRSSARA